MIDSKRVADNIIFINVFYFVSGCAYDVIKMVDAKYVGKLTYLQNKLTDFNVL